MFISAAWTTRLCLVTFMLFVFKNKIVAKLIAERIRPIIHDIISPYLSAFVPGRWIAKNTALTQEIVHSIKRKKTGKGHFCG